MRDRIGRYASALLVSAIATLCGFARQGVDARTAEALLIVFSEGSHIGQDPAGKSGPAHVQAIDPSGPAG